MSAPAAQVETRNTETIPWHQRRPWRTKFIEVVNESNRDLVLTFVHEGRLQLKRQERTTKRGANFGAGAGAGLDCLAEFKAGLRFSTNEVDQMFFEAGNAIVDHRVLHVGQPCKVDFLRGCKEMRVRGYYREPIDSPKALVLWKNTIYGRSVRITAPVMRNRSMGDPKVEEVGRLEQLPLWSLLGAAAVVILGVVAAYFFAPAAS